MITVTCCQEGELPVWGCCQDGIRYGHEWIRHLVELVNATSGHWDVGWAASGLPAGYQPGWTEVWRFGAAAANHPSPS